MSELNHIATEYSECSHERLCQIVEEQLRRIAELETDLKLNAGMLARQCDLAREAEIEAARQRNENARLQVAASYANFD